MRNARTHIAVTAARGEKQTSNGKRNPQRRSKMT